MSIYYRESFDYPPIRMFFDSNGADTISNNGNVTFTLNQAIQLPSNVLGYISLQELTIANTNYNINTYNNTLVLVDYASNTQTFTITPGNYTVTTFLTALNAALANGANNFLGITVTYSDLTNMFTFTCPHTYTLGLNVASTMNNCVGFLNGAIANSYTTQTGTSTTISTTITRNLISITLNQSDQFNFIDHTGTNRAVIIPPNALYGGAALAAAINLLTNAYNITCAYNAGTQLFSFTDTTSANPFIVLSTKTCLLNFGFSAVQNWTSALIPITCTLVSPCIIDLSGNNGFYFTTNLATSNYNFVTLAGGSGSNILEKIQLTSDGTGIEFFKNINQFKTRFSDKNITNINIVLLDENFNQWIPTSTFTCVLDFIFYEKYTELSHEKVPNLFQQMYKK